MTPDLKDGVRVVAYESPPPQWTCDVWWGQWLLSSAREDVREDARRLAVGLAQESLSDFGERVQMALVQLEKEV